MTQKIIQIHRSPKRLRNLREKKVKRRKRKRRKILKMERTKGKRILDRPWLQDQMVRKE
jgi:hypothetical protein